MGNPKRRKQKKAILSAAETALAETPAAAPVAEKPAPAPVKKSLADAKKEVATKPALKKDKN
jgi:hypothetical protein